MTHKDTLNKFLNPFKVGKGEVSTNTSMGNPKMSYNIPDDKYDEFKILYTACINNGYDLHITEKPCEISPMRIDLDFRFDYDGENLIRYYKKEHIENIICEYSKIITDTFQIDDAIHIFIQEKEKPSTFRSKIKDGIHIIFPKIMLDYNQQHYVRSKILKSNAFNGIPFTNKIEDVVDEAIIDRNYWLMYGSKKLESQSYTVSSMYEYKNDILQNKSFHLNEYNNFDYINMFSMRETNTALIVKNSIKNEYDTFVENKNVKMKKSTKNDDTVFSMITTSIKNIISEPSLINNLMNCLDIKRADNYHDWIELGWVLYNINPSEEHLNIWIDFSKQGSSYKIGECEKLWNTFKIDNKGLGTLKWWAKNDNPQKYNEIIDITVSKKIDIAIRSDGAHYDVANVITEIMNDKIIYDKQDENFYKVNELNIWRQEKEFLPHLCATEICKSFLKRAMYWTNQIKNDNEGNSIEAEYSKKAIKIAQQLKNTSYVKNLKDQLKGLLIQENFITKKLDANINLFAFQNGLYDLQKCEFRNIEPTDYIQINTDYEMDIKVDKSIVDEVYDFIKEMFKTDEMFGYVLDVLTYLMFGKNKFQEFYIFTGIGSNGKSLLIKLIKLAFGEYATTLRAETFTKPSKGANETTEMYKCKGLRMITFEEPSDDDKLITNRFKEYSGDGTITVRGLFKNPIEFMPQFKIIGACNDIPQFSKVDKAILRRARIIEFPYRFCEKPIGLMDKKMDINLGEKIENDIRYRQAFMFLLMKNWEKIKNYESMNTPEEVLEYTKQFMDSCNEVKKFIEEYYIIDKDQVTEEDRETTTNIYKDFKMITRNYNITETTFGNRLNDMGIRSKKNSKGIMCRIGIKKKIFVEED